MSYLRDKQSTEYIREASDKAFYLMSEYNVIPTPANYQIWYSYAVEENISLNQVISEMIKKQRSFTSAVCENLYERFFSNNMEETAVANAGQGIQSELANVAKTVTHINQDNEKYGSALNLSLKGIQNIHKVEELKDIILSLLEETQKITTSNDSAKQKLKESANTVQKLQSALNFVRQESLTDMLTNIGNRKSFEENIKSFLKEANEKNTELCLIFGDIDNFKIFNDNWGHHVGDQVLKTVAHTIKTRVGINGIAARYGGEEFAILLPGTSIEKAFEISEDIRKSIEQRKMKRKITGEAIGKITSSFGVAKYRSNEHRNDFLQRVDAALYKSKSTGRNKVTLEDSGNHKIFKIG